MLNSTLADNTQSIVFLMCFSSFFYILGRLKGVRICVLYINARVYRVIYPIYHILYIYNKINKRKESKKKREESKHSHVHTNILW